MQKQTIRNRKGQRIVVLVEQKDHARGLAFIVHGLSGNKEQPHIVTFAEAFKEKGYTVLRFDTTNTFGESDGKYEDATITNYFEDLEDVIAWAKKQDWYSEPFYLAGQSMGGMAVILYAQKHNREVKGVAAISALISGKLSKETFKQREELKDWERTGWRIEKSKSRPELTKRLPWSHMIDRLKYDVLINAHKLRMPVLIIVGENDPVTPIKHQQLFYTALQTKKELHIIKNAGHDFRTEQELQQVKHIFLQWIDSVDS